MELITIVFSVCVLFSIVTAQRSNAPCFDFPGDAYLRFSLDNFDNNGGVHYSLQFRTGADNGIILYASGRQGDDEALFIREGKLVYSLFNTSPTGVENYFGGFYESKEWVNTNEWVTVHLYRNWQVMDYGNRRARNQTGIIIQMNNEEHEYVDYANRDDLSILPDIYIGGYREKLSETVGFFDGLITDIREEKNDRLFANPTLNYLSKVGLDCLGQVPPS